MRHHPRVNRQVPRTPEEAHLPAQVLEEAHLPARVSKGTLGVSTSTEGACLGAPHTARAEAGLWALPGAAGLRETGSNKLCRDTIQKCRDTGSERGPRGPWWAAACSCLATLHIISSASVI